MLLDEKTWNPLKNHSGSIRSTEKRICRDAKRSRKRWCE